MKKLMLSVDELRVETFDTAARAEQRGTVAGQEYTTGGGRLGCDFGCAGDGPTEEYSCLCMSPVVACITEGGEAC